MTDRDPTPLNAEWAGETVFRCRLCPFDTLEEAKFIDHFARVHPPLEIIDGDLDEPDEPDEPTPVPARRRGRK